MAVIFTKTGGLAEAPATLEFDTILGLPTAPRKVIEYTRRLGSSKIIRQELGEEAIPTSCTLQKVFEPEGMLGTISADEFIADLNAACDPTTFYTLEANNNSTGVSFSNVAILDVNYTQKIVRGVFTNGNVESESVLLVEFTLTLIIDGA